jgi:hypothetical protein
MSHPDGEIDRFLRRRVCARCYGDLRKVPADDRKWEAVCLSCGDAWQGATISRKGAERRGQQALAELWEVKANLKDLFPNPHQNKPTRQILAELGY